jgi:hypothetical protein
LAEIETTLPKQLKPNACFNYLMLPCFNLQTSTIQNKNKRIIEERKRMPNVKNLSQINGSPAYSGPSKAALDALRTELKNDKIKQQGIILVEPNQTISDKSNYVARFVPANTLALERITPDNTLTKQLKDIATNWVEMAKLDGTSAETEVYMEK